MVGWFVEKATEKPLEILVTTRDNDPTRVTPSENKKKLVVNGKEMNFATEIE